MLSSVSLVVLLVALPRCQKRDGGEDDAKLDSARCASACAEWAATCQTETPLRARHAQCVEACRAARADAARAGCPAEQDRALRCLGTAKVSCQKASSSRSLLELGLGVEGCQAEFERLLRCAAHCQERGVVRSATRPLAVDGKIREVKAEQIALGCGPDTAALARHSPPGAPCEHFSVCSQGRCPCPGSNSAYLARACVDGRCAPDTLACSIVPSAVGHDACPAR